MNIRWIFFSIILVLFYCQQISCFMEHFESMLEITFDTAEKLVKRFKLLYGDNRCSHDDLQKNITALELMMNEHLYGQHIAGTYVLAAIGSHINEENPSKPLTMIFHGKTGTGKNYLASMIAETYFKIGEKSNYYHFINGRNDFPIDKSIIEYKIILKDLIIKSLSSCSDSLFVFDEVDMMPSGVLDVLVPFLNYKKDKKMYHNGHFIDIETNRAIFIFLTNTGIQEIIDTLFLNNKEGKKREDMVLSDFEKLISLGAFNEKGGFYKSDAISTSLIDHYVPFLPLEEKHVRLCIEAAFRRRNSEPNENLIKEVMAYVTFEESPHDIYVKSGCKRLEQKVATIVYKNRVKTR